MKYGEYYYDSDSHLTIQTLSSVKFIPTTHNLTKPFNPKSALWFRIKVTNTNLQPLQLILEHDYPHIEYIQVYQNGQLYVEDGLFLPNKDKTLNSTFSLKLMPQTTSEVVIKIASSFSLLKAQFVLYDKEYFNHKEYRYQLQMTLLFGGILTLIIYHLLIYLHSKDRIYLYYLIFASLMLFHQSVNRGFFDVHISNLTPFLLSLYMPITTLALLAHTLFSYRLVSPSKGSLFQRIFLGIIIYLGSYTIYGFVAESGLNYTMLLTFIPIYLFLLLMGLYLYFFKRQKEIRYYALGWVVYTFATIMFVSHYRGYITIPGFHMVMYSYALLIELLFFALALSDRLSMIQDKLLTIQSEQKRELKLEVEKKTEALTDSLNERKLLFQELQHRVKNNLQMILSFLRLQKDDADPKTQESFTTLENRIQSISLLHDQLYHDKSLDSINTNDYIQTLITNITHGMVQSNIKVNQKVTTTIPTSQLIYCGIVLNELLTNAIKYAYSKEGGTIDIILQEHQGHKQLIVQDYGEGKPDKSQEGLGSMIVEAIVESELDGELTYQTDQGTKAIITF
jgi:two-component sensor histidine kinase